MNRLPRPKVFFSCAHFLKNPRIKSLAKFERYKRDITSVVLFGCGVWTLAQCLLTRLVSFENTVLRLMTRCPRKTTASGKLEPFITWRRRHTTAARKLFHSRIKYIHICEVYLGRMFDFACKLFRGPATVEILVMRDVAIWRNQSWWRTLQAVGEKKRRVESPQWRHAIVGKKPLQWEDPFCFVWGPGWIDVIREASSETLACMRNEFIQGGLDFVGNFSIYKGNVKKSELTPIQLVKEIPLEDTRPRPDFLTWSATFEDTTRIQIMGDSKVACSWLNGQFRFAPANRLYKHMFHAFQQGLLDAWTHLNFASRTNTSHFAIFFCIGTSIALLTRMIRVVLIFLAPLTLEDLTSVSGDLNTCVCGLMGDITTVEWGRGCGSKPLLVCTLTVSFRILNLFVVLVRALKPIARREKATA